MSSQMPQAIATYFEADRQSAAAVAGCFTPEAVVKDEGNTYRGAAEIEAWKTMSSQKYNYISTPIAIDEKDDCIVITCHLVGDFPGSPVDLRYFFTLAGNKIATLEITL